LGNPAGRPARRPRTARSTSTSRRLPLLKEETLQLQFGTATRLEMLSGATDTTVAFQKSIQAALIAGKKA
jgi:hypothetical protein